MRGPRVGGARAPGRAAACSVHASAARTCARWTPVSATASVALLHSVGAWQGLSVGAATVRRCAASDTGARGLQSWVHARLLPAEEESGATVARRPARALGRLLTPPTRCASRRRRLQIGKQRTVQLLPTRRHRQHRLRQRRCVRGRCRAHARARFATSSPHAMRRTLPRGLRHTAGPRECHRTAQAARPGDDAPPATRRFGGGRARVRLASRSASSAAAAAPPTYTYTATMASERTYIMARDRPRARTVLAVSLARR